MLAERGHLHRLEFRAVVGVQGNVEQAVVLRAEALDRRDKLCAFLVAENDIALGQALHILGERLRHTAREDDDAVGILAAHAVEQLAVFRVADCRDGAAVDDGDVGAVPVIGGHIAVPDKILAHCLRLVLIHLAAER